MKKIGISSRKRDQLVDITSEVRRIVRDSDVDEGVCLIYCPHTTAAITVNEGADPAVQVDLLGALEKIVPDIDFQHMEGNSDAHLKSSLIGAGEEVIVRNGDVRLGRWQRIFFCEFDGPRSRKVWIEVNEG